MFLIRIIFKKILLLILLKLSGCDILVYDIESRSIEIEFKDVPSKFGEAVPPEGITGLVVYSNPPEACVAIQKPPILQNYTGKWIVLIRRYGCEFELKVRNAQIAGYDAAIVHNVDSSVLKPMAADNPNKIHIPSVFIGSEAGLLIKNNYLFDNGYFILITDDVPFNFTSQLLIIFSVLVAFCIFVIIFFLIVKYFKDRRRQRRYCLPKSSLNKITIHKFKKNDPYEICAICLEEYVENDKLRVLPCSHAYHSKCIDPWLTKSRRVCPVCKRKVFTTGETAAESDSDTEDETAPLVRASGTTTNAGTFTRAIENPLRRWSSSDSGSALGSAATTPSSRTNSYRSVPEAGRHFRRAVGGDEVRNVPHEYSINSGSENRGSTPGRISRQRSIPRNDTERC
ncbi:hypothetical protein RUM43_000834 [Polyplax serrata]|uniref:RING-type E3 ubiquitin transferase n=1 Tax=Polyplax serrata TaxID=468196 RepID=A0AAN8SDD8_POLSC